MKKLKLVSVFFKGLGLGTPGASLVELAKNVAGQGFGKAWLQYKGEKNNAEMIIHLAGYLVGLVLLWGFIIGKLTMAQVLEFAAFFGIGG